MSKFFLGVTIVILSILLFPFILTVYVASAPVQALKTLIDSVAFALNKVK
jgi:hypothetical protein